jgi:hypothetical protein
MNKDKLEVGDLVVLKKSDANRRGIGLVIGSEDPYGRKIYWFKWREWTIIPSRWSRYLAKLSQTQEE